MLVSLGSGLSGAGDGLIVVVVVVVVVVLVGRELGRSDVEELMVRRSSGALCRGRAELQSVPQHVTRSVIRISAQPPGYLLYCLLAGSCSGVLMILP